MKKLLMSSIVSTIFALSITVFQMSCKKDATTQTTTPTKEQILTQKTWKVDRLHHIIAGAFSSYTNGGTNTTGINYDNLRFTFNAKGTGTHINQLGVSYTTPWQFTSADKRILMLTVNAPVVVTNTWEMVEIAGTKLHASTNLTISGTNNLETLDWYKYLKISRQ